MHGKYVTHQNKNKKQQHSFSTQMRKIHRICTYIQLCIPWSINILQETEIRCNSASSQLQNKLKHNGIFLTYKKKRKSKNEKEKAER